MDRKKILLEIGHVKYELLNFSLIFMNISIEVFIKTSHNCYKQRKVQGMNYFLLGTSIFYLGTAFFKYA